LTILARPRSATSVGPLFRLLDDSRPRSHPPCRSDSGCIG
jgi:hypothetical protein